jgi:hypothetical protein
MSNRRIFSVSASALFVLASLIVVAAPYRALDCGKEGPKLAAITPSCEAKEAPPAYNPLPGAGQKVWIGQEHFFVYSFDKKPQMGTVILKIQLFDRDGKRSTSLSITGDCGMPSMGSAHDTGPQPFKLNRKGDYLLPLNIVMPGEWEVKLDFLKDKKVIYYGSLKFKV